MEDGKFIFEFKCDNCNCDWYANIGGFIVCSRCGLLHNQKSFKILKEDSVRADRGGGEISPTQPAENENEISGGEASEAE